MTRLRTSSNREYHRFRRVNGKHPFKRSVPGAHVAYGARRRRNGRVAYFNFGLAREIGLIPERHPDQLNHGLRRAILDTFSLVIINEYDLLKGSRYPSRDVLPQTYMATRYLQLQHPGRSGLTSGDGRSIWNGWISHRGVAWDISSCGTGVTRLCPATAIEEKFFRTGNRYASYGCGTAAVAEGLSGALMSETFHRNGIPTERVLAVIEFPGGLAINVRAARNLLRPSHFFVHLKQGDLESLRATVDCFIDRQLANGVWPERKRRNTLYRFLAEETARTFGRTAAVFESEYIFCWLDWDGDNVLTTGEIVDYGSVRQFGLYHREYRFADVDRLSTTLPEQRRKARRIVQTFAQIRDFLCTGEKRPIDSFRTDRVLKIFDAEFQREKDQRLLHRIGLGPKAVTSLLRAPPAAFRRFQKAYAYFERAKSSRGVCKVPDGLTWNAVFCTRDLLRELPVRLRDDAAPLPPEAFLEIALSSYATRKDRAATPQRRRMATEFQRTYLDLLRTVARRSGTALPRLLKTVARRSASINRAGRITGDSVDYATARLVRNRKKLSAGDMHRLIERFVESQDLNPNPRRQEAPGAMLAERADVRRVLDRMLELVTRFREGL